MGLPYINYSALAYAALALFAMSDTVTRFTEYVARPRVDCDVVEAMQLALKPFHTAYGVWTVS